MGLMTTIRLLAAAALLVLASGQQQPAASASCTASLLTSFTPCFSFLTSSNGSSGSPPTRECCRSLAALVDAGTGCACLVLTGAVPLGVPVNRTLAVSLPRACDSMSVPLQCRDTSAQSPATGPVAADTPPATPASPAAATTPDAPTATAPVTQGREAVLPTSGSARRASARVAATPALVLLLLLAVAAALV